MCNRNLWLQSAQPHQHWTVALEHAARFWWMWSSTEAADVWVRVRCQQHETTEPTGRESTVQGGGVSGVTAYWVKSVDCASAYCLLPSSKGYLQHNNAPFTTKLKSGTWTTWNTITKVCSQHRVTRTVTKNIYVLSLCYYFYLQSYMTQTKLNTGQSQCIKSSWGIRG